MFRLRFLQVLAVSTALGLAGLTARATTVIPPTFTQLAQQSDYVVRARVKAVSAARTVDPAGRAKINTRVELEVLEVIAGHPPSPLVLVMLGGRADGRELIVQGAPVFRVGDEDILFVQGNGRNFNPLLGLMYGRYPVRQDEAGRSYVARSNGVPLGDVGEVALPMAAGSVAELQARLRAAGGALSATDFARLVRRERGEADPATAEIRQR